MAMKIRDLMIKDPITVSPQALLGDAQELMQTHKIRRLPVVQGKKLVGFVTRSMLLEAAPSPATSLNMYELNYLLAKMKVEDIMVTDPVTVHPDMPVEEALLLGQEKGIGGFPVVENGELVGVATEGDVVRIITSILGLKEEGVRLTIEGLGKRLSELTEILVILNRHKVPILSMMTMPRPEKKDWLVFMRIRTGDASAVAEDMKKEGFSVTYVD
jgi:acetoin utilization protein AcuB